jgi:hypothetical protein
MTKPLSEKTLAEIRDRVQSLREKYHEGDVATSELLLGIDIQSLLLAYEQARVENARLRAKIDDWRRYLREAATDGTRDEGVETMHRIREMLKQEKDK